ncbi:MAG TPA: ELM1/GtrOC1 family putative glycosyltransferase [bacterium]|nr:ELM1/GtrOC1 family putative glycosyltransferase [bacterium]HOL49831.1 ELM1/GtrOC1 family putative glycosyltransferase [bacterium]HPO51244.1 ELM1/GtrOC1 family putative glycosyltransferase [bacterium]
MKILILDDGIPGNTNQSVGVAEATGYEFHILPVNLKGLSYKLPGRKGSTKIASKLIGSLLKVNAYRWADFVLKISSKTDIPAEKFDIVISAGSFLAPINLVISRKVGAKAISIMTPEMTPLKQFDLLIVPVHDTLRYPFLAKLQNLFVTIGAPNRINADLLKSAMSKMLNKIKIPETPKIGVIIGGNDQNYFIDIEWARKLLSLLKMLAERKFVFFLTTSRRTPANVVHFLKEKTNIDNFVYREFPGISPDSHYFGILGICDILFVTEDSITMMSEVCSTGKPVIILGTGRKKRNIVFDTTIETLVKNKYCLHVPVDKFEQIPDILLKISNENPFPILEDSKQCAKRIIELVNQEGS